MSLPVSPALLSVALLVVDCTEKENATMTKLRADRGSGHRHPMLYLLPYPDAPVHLNQPGPRKRGPSRVGDDFPALRIDRLQLPG